MRLEQRDASQVVSSFSSQRAALTVGCNVDAEEMACEGSPGLTYPAAPGLSPSPFGA